MARVCNAPPGAKSRLHKCRLVRNTALEVCRSPVSTGAGPSTSSGPPTPPTRIAHPPRARRKRGAALGNDVLEDFRLLTNYAMDSEPRLCLLLVGLTELRRRLSMAVHESLTQRIVVRYHLGGFAREKLPEYLAHPLALVRHHLAAVRARGLRSAVPGHQRPAAQAEPAGPLRDVGRRAGQAAADHRRARQCARSTRSRRCHRRDGAADHHGTRSSVHQIRRSHSEAVEHRKQIALSKASLRRTATVEPEEPASRG